VPESSRSLDRSQVARALRGAREYTSALVADLDDRQWIDPPRLATINPFLWEVGHVGWFMRDAWTREMIGGPTILSEPPERL